MPAGQDSGITEEQIYVRLIGEGTDVYRPARAILVGPGGCLLGREEHDDTETWDFEPGTVSGCQAKVRRRWDVPACRGRG